jgi:S-adenosylmethionine:tRNA ribosyltransferase-isomerase
VEVFLLRPLAGATQTDTHETWEAMIRFRGAEPGMSCSILDATNTPADGAEVTLIEKISEKTWSVEIQSSVGGTVRDLIEQCGHMPIPPYINRSGMSEQELRDRYQTVYASLPGSAAAPTAGLHFTPELLATLEQMGVERAEVTLHVGLGTFSPITTDNLDEHTMHSERIEISEAAAEQINRAKAEGRRVIAVGTTSVRVLESLAENNRVQAGSMDTQIFIRPGYQFQIIDGLITNFHIPESTLLLLVAAFAGVETAQHAYDTAVAEKYRFYSFGDAMLIL